MADPVIRGSRVPEWLERIGKKQVDLARHLGVTETYISKVCKNKEKFSVEKMKKTADFFGCNMDDLVVWEYETSTGKRQ